MASKTIIIHPEKCNNCKECEIACAESKSSLTSPGLSCVRIIREKYDETEAAEDFFFPVACKQCENPPCMAVCLKEAIYKEGDRVLIDRKKCVGCGMCVSACPFGAVRLDRASHKSFKCDLCGDDPECVKVCETNAIEFADIEMLTIPSRYQAAERMMLGSRV